MGASLAAFIDIANADFERKMALMRSRHSVRSFTDKPLSADERKLLEAEIARGNAEGKLHMRLVCDEPNAFDSTMAHYGKFANVRNYLVLAGAPSADLDERVGYYGERVMLLAQALGLAGCWVALTFKKRYVKKSVDSADKLVVVIALGYAAQEGADHKVKAATEVSKVPAGKEAPEWFSRGVEAALLAPTAMNQQKFELELTENTDAKGRPVVVATSKGGAYSSVDLGIVRLHFELGAGEEPFTWAQ